MSAFPLFITHVGDTVNCKDRPNHCAIVLWGQKDRANVLNLETRLAEMENLGNSPPPSISEVTKAKIVCLKTNGKWVRALIEPLHTSSLIEAFCIDYGFHQQVQVF